MADRPVIPFVDMKSQYLSLKPLIDARIQSVLDHGQYILGPEVQELEDALADHVGVKHAVGVSDGTTALLVALLALDIGAGDEVITSPFTFIATAEVISLLGAIPVFVDIDPRTYNIDPHLIEQALSPKTRAILPVSLYGQCAEMDQINRIAESHGLPVIEDAAQSLGATHRTRQSGGISTIGCTSFFPSKPLGCYGDGGACFTDDDTLAARMRQIRSHGQEARYRHAALGLNGRLDTLQAAILLAKMESFPQEIERRKAAARRYSQLIGERDFQHRVTLPHVEPWNTSVYAQYTVQVNHRDMVVSRLAELGVPTAVHYPLPLHRQPLYEAGTLPLRICGELKTSESASSGVMSLPFYAAIDEGLQAFIVDSLFSALLPR